MSHILHCAISVFVLFSLLLAESLSLLKYISCHGNDVIVCKTIYCPWKGIHDETERQHVLKRDPTESSHVRTQISKPWFQSTPPPPPSCGPIFPKLIRKAPFLATYTKYTPNKIYGLMLEETIDALEFTLFSLGWEAGRDGRDWESERFVGIITPLMVEKEDVVLLYSAVQLCYQR